MRYIRLALVGYVALLSARVAGAGSLSSPALSINVSANQRVICMLANSGTKSIGPVTLRVIRSTGTEAGSVTHPALLPGVTGSLVANAVELGVTSFARCTAEGGGVSKKTPLSICVLPTGSLDCLASASAP